MSLLHPTPGEIIDRISIVGLKAIAYKKSGRRTESLDSEAMELIISLDSFGPISNEVERLRHELTEINSLLWGCEDEVRKSYGALSVFSIAKNISHLNDKRNMLVRAINEAYGIEPGEEKVYS